MVQTHEEHGSFRKVESVAAKSDGRREEATPLTFTETILSFNDRLMKDQVDQNQINVAIWENLIDNRHRV